MKKIINYGSLNIDRVYEVAHFPAPGETISSFGYSIFPGGKGLNQSIALSRAGAQVCHVGCVGKDGLWLVDILRENGVDTQGVVALDDDTGHAIIQVDQNGQNCILLHGGTNLSIPDSLIAAAIGQCEAGDYLLLQNEVNANRRAIDFAVRKEMTIALNPSPIDQAILDLPFDQIDWLLLNEVEGRVLANAEDSQTICNRLLEKHPHLKIVLTLGASGVMYKDIQTTYQHGVYRVPVVDTTAAGDTFTGFFLGSVANGIPIEEALRVASIASSLAVSKKGASVSIPVLAEVQTANLLLL